MLRESYDARPDAGMQRRWFADDYFDLIVWYSNSSPERFQLCYDKERTEHAITWTPKGMSHDVVDQGEQNPTRNRTPVLEPDGVIPKADLIQRFSAASQELESELREFVLEKLAQLPGPAA